MLGWAEGDDAAVIVLEGCLALCWIHTHPDTRFASVSCAMEQKPQWHGSVEFMMGYAHESVLQ